MYELVCILLYELVLVCIVHTCTVCILPLGVKSNTHALSSWRYLGWMTKRLSDALVCKLGMHCFPLHLCVTRVTQNSILASAQYEETQWGELHPLTRHLRSFQTKRNICHRLDIHVQSYRAGWRVTRVTHKRGDFFQLFHKYIRESMYYESYY